MSRLEKEKEDRLAKRQAKNAERERIKEVKKAAKDAEKARKKAIKDKAKANDKEKKDKTKVTKKVVVKKTKKVKKTKTKAKNIDDQINAALNYYSSTSASEDEDPELYRKDLNNSWSSKSSEINTSDLLPSDDNDDMDDMVMKPSTSTGTKSRGRNLLEINENDESEMSVETETQVDRDDVNDVEIDIGGKSQLIKENVTYVLVDYEGQTFPGMIPMIY